MRFSGCLALLVTTVFAAAAKCKPGQVFNPTVPLNFSIGADGPQDPATVGFLSQHVAIFVQDYDRALRFYRDTLGMRTAFEVLWDTYKVGYLSYSGGGGPDAEHETGYELFQKQPFLRGAFEIQWYKGIKRPRPVPGNGISHYGITVPDMAAAVARLDAAGATFLKRPGQPPSNAVGEYYGFPKNVFPEWFKVLIPLSYAFILDPEGYLLELSPQTPDVAPPS